MSINECWQFLVNKASRLAGLDFLNTRKTPAIYYRYAIYKILYDEGYSYSAIGRVANKSYCTVIHAINVINDLMPLAPSVKRIYESLIKPSIEEEIERWLKLPESKDPVKTAYHFYGYTNFHNVCSSSSDPNSNSRN